ncbi:hypothetical protein MOV08_38675 [Streptomyces yunnanensis]|uniref:Uncharacterized protein n=1 Tax=Streptomyces yunnanensis TaxID=156453 RepID=A0ABY8AHX0_9ACTN|nr:hypothetical protein [Streptomyces yunnanensis]WEB44630.1 hypothetical protein MOV08_38675 [Streptomyces yunnanensis]
MNGLRIDDPSIAGGSLYQVGRDTVLRDTALALKTVTPTPVGGFVTRWDHLTPDENWDKEWKESQAGDREAPSGKVMVGHRHRGDENGWTGHRYARITID